MWEWGHLSHICFYQYWHIIMKCLGHEKLHVKGLG